MKALVSSAVSSIGALDVTNFADGFAKFLVKRTKQELNMAFFTRFKEELSKAEYRDLQTVFPQTWRALQAIGDEVYNYQRYLQTLRESFEKDLANLLTHIPTVIDNHPEFFKTQPELEAILRTAFYIAGSLQSKQHPRQDHRELSRRLSRDRKPQLQSQHSDFKTIFQFAALLRFQHSQR